MYARMLMRMARAGCPPHHPLLARTSAVESPSVDAVLSLASCPSSRVKRRRSRSWASGAGLHLTAATRSSAEALRRFSGFVRLVASLKIAALVKLVCA